MLTVEVRPVAVGLVEGETVQLEAVVRNSAGHPVRGQEVTWSSDRPDIASVDAGGRVTGGPVAGTATLRAWCMSRGSAPVTATCTGPAAQAPVPPASEPAAGAAAGYEVRPLALEASAGTEVAVDAQLVDAAGAPLREPGRVVMWDVNDPEAVVLPRETLTDGDGVASATLRLGTLPGTTVVVTAVDETGVSGAGPGVLVTATPPWWRRRRGE
jgi:hypothetical protein